MKLRHSVTSEALLQVGLLAQTNCSVLLRIHFFKWNLNWPILVILLMNSGILFHCSAVLTQWSSIVYIVGVKLISSHICVGKQIWVLAINIGPSETRKKVTEPWLLSGCSHLQLIYGPRDSINYEFAMLMWRFDRPDKDIFSPAPWFFHHSKYMIFSIKSFKERMVFFIIVAWPTHEAQIKMFHVLIWTLFQLYPAY